MSRTLLNPRGGECACTRPFFRTGGMCLHMPHLLLVAALSSLLAASALFAQWQYLPTGHPSLGPLVSDSSSNTIWLSSHAAGVWLSEDGGDVWQPASNRFTIEGGFSADWMLALDPAADTLIMVGLSRTRRSMEWYSFDGGMTWLPAPQLTPYFTSFVISPHNHSQWFRANYEFCWRSSDYGQTWALLSLPGESWESNIYIDPLEDSTIFITAPSVWKSNDQGNTWEMFLGHYNLPIGTSGQTHSLLRMSNGELAALGEYHDSGEDISFALVVSSDNGQSWSSLLNSDAISTWPRIMEDPAIPGRLYQGGFRSDDFGRTWYAYGDLSPGTYMGHLYQNQHSGTLYLSDDECLWRSADHGDHWELLEFLPVGVGGRLAVCAEAVIMNREGGEGIGPEWTLENFSSGWQSIPPPQGALDTTIDSSPIRFKRDDVLYRITHFGVSDSLNWQWSRRVAQSSNNGQTWTFGFPFDHTFGWGATSMLDDGEIVRWLESESTFEVADTLLMSEDLGLTWSAIGSFDGEIAIIVQTQQMICVEDSPYPSDFSRVYRTTDLGATWELLGDDSVDVGSVVLLGDGIYATRNGHCVAWNENDWEIRGNLPTTDAEDLSLVAISGGEQVLVAAVSDSTKLWTSNDFGWTWRYRDFQLPYEEQCMGIYNIAGDPYRNCLWASTSIGHCYLPLAELSADGPLSFKPADYTLLSIYPNPFNSSTRIRYDLLKRENVEINLYNLQGRFVKALADEIQSAGRHELDLSLSDFASGVYFVQLKTASTHKVEKLMLLK